MHVKMIKLRKENMIIRKTLTTTTLTKTKTRVNPTSTTTKVSGIKMHLLKKELLKTNRLMQSEIY